MKNSTCPLWSRIKRIFGGKSCDNAEAREELALAYIKAFGGAENVVEITHCSLRLRLKINNLDAMNEDAILKLGARSIVKPSQHTTQIVIGTEAQTLAEDIRLEWKKLNGPVVSQQGVDFTANNTAPVIKPTEEDLAEAEKLIALIGKHNITHSSEAAHRLLIGTKEANEAVVAELEAAGYELMAKGDRLLINVERAEVIAQAINDLCL